jgi:Flp pilus assembly protein TadD
MFCDWDWAGAGREYGRAVAVNPGCAEAHHMHAHWHQTMGRFDRALEGMDRALEIEPVAPGLHSCLAEILFYARRYDETVRQCGKTLELAPGFAGIYGWLGMAHVLGGRIETGLEAVEEGLRRRPGDPRLQALLGAGCALAGRREEALDHVGRLDALAREKYVDPYYAAWPRAALGDVGAALLWLTRACDEHSPWAYLLKIDPLLDGLRSEPRFAELLARVHLSG